MNKKPYVTGLSFSGFDRLEPQAMAAQDILERGAVVLEGCLRKLTHIESRLMHGKLRGHEFVRVWYQNVSVFNESIDKVRYCQKSVRVSLALSLSPPFPFSLSLSLSLSPSLSLSLSLSPFSLSLSLSLFLFL